MIGPLTGEGAVECEGPKKLAILTCKQQLLSIDMKTKDVQNVPRIRISI